MKLAMRPLFICALAPFAHGRTIDFEVDAGAIAEDHSLQVAQKNGAALNSTLASLQPADVLVIPNKTFAIMGGIHAVGLDSVTIQIDGTLEFSDNIKHWPLQNGGRPAECIQLENPRNVTFTASGKGTLNGQGNKWWGIPGIGYLIRTENRPRLMKINNGKDILVENLLFKDSPYWTFSADVDGLEIRNSDIDARRMHDDGHNIIDITAFNTDGFDVGGKNIWIHDCRVWNQDDSICVKGNTENMLVERVNASGFGLTIGSVGGGTTIRNITFRDCYMHKTIKGIYMKFRAMDTAALIADVLYENIVIDEPSQYGIWIGPAQQSDSRKFWSGHPCSIFWPQAPGWIANCDVPAFGTYANITLRNITINNPKGSPGLIYANETNPMQNVVFDNVRVNNPGKEPFGPTYFCKNVQGVATGNTWPVPDCFEDRTSNAMIVV